MRASRSSIGPIAHAPSTRAIAYRGMTAPSQHNTMDQVTEPTALPFDYNDVVFRHGTEAHGLDYSILRDEYRDVHPMVADRFAAAGTSPILDMGCGPTTLGALLDERGASWVGLDAAIRRLRRGAGPRVLGAATRSPFRDETFGGVAALYMLYHFPDPFLPISEAFRVLRPGGLFAACAPSRFDEPELAPFLPPQPPETFDAETAPGLLSRLFDVAGVDSWDMFLYRLPDRQAAWNYLVSRGATPDVAEAAARAVDYPLWLTKRGAVVWGRKADR